MQQSCERDCASTQLSTIHAFQHRRLGNQLLRDARLIGCKDHFPTQNYKIPNGVALEVALGNEKVGDTKTLARQFRKGRSLHLGALSCRSEQTFR